MEEDRRVNREENVETHFIHQQKQHPANLFESFWLEKTPKHTNPEAPEEPDLNLRLSLGSTDSENTLARSSSIAGVMNLRKASSEAEMSFLTLERSCSLPTEAEQVHRTFYLMELQRMMKEEAHKQPVEGQNNAKEAKGKKKSLANLKVAAWQTASLSKPTAQTPPIVKVKETGPKGSAAANADSSFKSSSQPKNLGPLVSSGANSNSNLVEPEETTPENAFKRPRISYGNIQDNGMDVMRQMPSVSTIGDGPNGRKVEGFLYRYVKGHVSIVCVCHGCFLSPAEFVKHAGGRDVPNPMQHITVSTSFSV